MNDIHYKSFEIKAFDKLKGIITGYGATYGNVDLTNEVVLQGSLDDDINAFTNGTKIIEFLYEHNSNIIFNATVDSLKSDATGMLTQATVSEAAKATYKVEWERFATYCSKGLGRMSIGYRVINAYVIINGEKKYYIKDGKYDWDIGSMIDELKLIKYLEKLTLYEISFTGNPANTQARILGIKKNRVRVAEGMEVLEMPNFKTKSEFEMALEGIKDANGTFSTVGFSKFLYGVRKGKYQLTQNAISRFVNTVDSIYKGKMPKQEIEKMLDNQNNDVKSETVPQDTVAQDLSENKSVPQNQTFADVINAAAKNFKK
jgi:HK97 family phage prohead protease